MEYIKTTKQVLSGKQRMIVGLLLVILTLCGCVGNTAIKGEETVRILSGFTTITQEDDIYEISYEAEDAGENDWVIRCTTDNNAIRIYDYEACKPLINYQGDAFGDYYFSYDFNEERASFYLDEEAYGASIVSYMIDDDEFVINANSKRYGASDEFDSFLRNSGLIDIINQDIETVRAQLEEYGIGYADVDNISIDALEKIYEQDGE